MEKETRGEKAAREYYERKNLDAKIGEWYYVTLIGIAMGIGMLWWNGVLWDFVGWFI